MNYTALQIERALAAGNQLRLHQNGFIQLDLPDEKSRLHVWSEELPKAQDPRTPIHNHRFCFKSKIIVGELTHQEYIWVPAERARDGDVVCRLYTGSGDYQNLVLAPEPYEGAVWEGGTFIYQVGDEYHFQHGAYHDSWGKGLTATIMTKTETDCIPYATVVVPLGEGGPDNDFRRDQYPQEVLMPFVAGVLAELKR